MANFNATLQAQTPPKLQLGLSENNDYFCLVVNDDGNFSLEWRAKPYSFKQFIEEVIGSDRPFTLIRTVSSQYIWRKSFCVPSHYSQRMIFIQILHLLQREIPLPIKEINFDYETLALPDSPLQKVYINALRKSYADQLVIDEETILDCELHAFLRGFHHYDQHDPETLYLIKDKVVRFTGDDVITDNDLATATWRPDPRLIDEEGNYFDQTVFIMALGASLWDID